MKKVFWLLLVIPLVISACSGGEVAVSASNDGGYTSSNLDTTYEGALPVRNQLALGTLKLQGTDQAVTPEQAAELIPLWQALRSTGSSGGSSEAEVNALLAQIEGVMTPEQLAAISALQLKQTDIQAWSQANGVAIGVDGGQPGAGRELSPEARATRQAEQGRTSQSGGNMSTAIVDAVIAYLETLQGDV